MNNAQIYRRHTTLPIQVFAIIGIPSSTRIARIITKLKFVGIPAIRGKFLTKSFCQFSGYHTKKAKTMQVLAASNPDLHQFQQIFRKLLQVYEKYCKVCSISWYKVLYELIYRLVQKPT